MRDIQLFGHINFYNVMSKNVSGLIWYINLNINNTYFTFFTWWYTSISCKDAHWLWNKEKIEKWKIALKQNGAQNDGKDNVYWVEERLDIFLFRFYLKMCPLLFIKSTTCVCFSVHYSSIVFNIVRNIHTCTWIWYFDIIVPLILHAKRVKWLINYTPWDNYLFT